MNIVVSFDQNVNTLPAGFVADVNAVVNYLESQYIDNITFNLHVGFGERDGQTLGAGSLGESAWNVNSFSYSQIKTALTNHKFSADDTTAVSSLPASDPIGGTHTYLLIQPAR